MNTKEIEETEKSVTAKENLDTDPPSILEEIHIEELAIDGICGIY